MTTNGRADKPVVFWFRRDLRLEDNRGLAKAAATGRPILPVFLFDADILKPLDRSDSRVTFIHRTLAALREELRGQGGDLWVGHGRPVECLERLLRSTGALALHTNRDFEPQALERDGKVRRLCEELGIPFETHLDHLIRDPTRGLKEDGGPYTVYTPYARKFMAGLTPEDLQETRIRQTRWQPGRAPRDWGLPTLEGMGFLPSPVEAPPLALSGPRAKKYGETRNHMGLADGTTHWGVHLRFGTLGIRKAFRFAMAHSRELTAELVWREFFAQIMAHFPHVLTEPFRAFGKAMPTRASTRDWEAWCEGRTGYPVVDAGMRELVATGTMHNRVRMVVASFLSKHLLLDYRLGEAFFARHLLDFERASNNGNWQWAAGTGTDAAPYFRIFNPAAQAAKFDPGGGYVRKWVPEVGTPAYPEPIVDHAEARVRALAAYDTARRSSSPSP